MVGQRIQHYEIISKLGAGGMGEVWLATDTKLGRKVALKFLPREFATDPDRRRRLELEATSASSIDHPNILTIYEINEHDGHPFIAMAYVDGETLKEKLLHGHLPLEQAMRYGIQLASALGGAHAHGIIHRDVKPDNVLIGRDDRARLTDFGLAKMKETSGLTNRGSTVGTVGYMSPEQAQGLNIDARSDVFSLGVMLYEMFSGRLPFAAEHAAAALYSIVHEQPPPIRRINPNIPESLVAVIDRALAKKLDDRYSDGGAVEADLRAVARSLEISRISSGQLPAYRSRPRRRVLWGVVGVAAIISGLVFAFSGPDEENSTGGEAVATENTLAVLNFENLSDPADPERQGDIIAELLTTDLSASEYVKVVSSQRLYDLLKQEAGQTSGKIDRSDAIHISKRAGATQMLTGALSRLSGRSIITAQIVDVSSGDVIGSELVDGTDLFAMVDSLSFRIKRRIGLSESQILAGDIPVSEATTSSAEAYRAYLKGMEAYHALDWADAHPWFDNAIDLDSTFALAYLRKGVAYFSDGRAEDGYRFMAIARRHMDRVPLCERYLLQALAVDVGEKRDFEGAFRTLKRATVECPTHKEPFFWVANFASGGIRNEPDTAIVYARRALELDPDYAYALLKLGDALLDRKEYGAAREVANHYLHVRPRDVYPYSLLGDLALKQGQFDSARAWHMKAVEVAPDQRNGYREIARIFVLQGQPDSAIDWYSQTLASENVLTRNLALRSIGSVHRALGHFQSSVEHYRKAASMAHAAQLRELQAQSVSGVGWVYMDGARYDLAVREFERVSELDTISPLGAINQAIALTYLDQPGDARRIIRDVETEWQGRFDSAQMIGGRHALEACIALNEDRFEDAVAELKLARRYLNDSTQYRADMAEALIGLGRYSDALTEVHSLRRDAEVQWPSTEYLRGLYLEADASVRAGRPKEAVEPLQRLMVFWGEADWEVPWLTEARKLYANLTAQ